MLVGVLAAPGAAQADTATGTDLSGRWLLQYTPKGMGAHSYSALLTPADDADCVAAHLTSPCYSGFWWNVVAARTESRVLFAVVRSGDQLVLTGGEPAGAVVYHYHGSAAAVVAPMFIGTVDNDAGTAPATFTLTRTPYAPEATTPLQGHPAVLDLTGTWRLDYRPRGIPPKFYSIELTPKPDDLCSDVYGLAPPCFGGTWHNLTSGQTESTGYFTAVNDHGRLVMQGVDAWNAGAASHRYQGASVDSGRTFTGLFTLSPGATPADFTFTLTSAAQAPLTPTDGTVVPDDYIVASKTPPDGNRAPVTAHAIAAGIQVRNEYRWAIGGFAATMTPAQLDAVRHDPDTAEVDHNTTNSVHLDDEPTDTAGDITTPIGLNRIQNQQDPTGRFGFAPPGTGTGVDIYVLDSGVWGRHDDFTTSPGSTRVEAGVDEIGGGDDSCGHGTQVAGVAAGREHGVAIGAAIIPVRVAAFGKEPDGSYGCVINDNIVMKGLEWIESDARQRLAQGHREVLNISLGWGPPNHDEPWPDMLKNAIKTIVNSGVTTTMAAGNSGSDASTLNFPLGAIVVGATAIDDTRSIWSDDQSSNYGARVDLYAPGTQIESSLPGPLGSLADHYDGFMPPDPNRTDLTRTDGGTSFAAPFVAGAAALYLGSHPTATPQQVKSFLVTTGTDIQITQPDKPPTVVKLLYVPRMYLTQLILHTRSQGDGVDSDSTAVFMFNSQLRYGDKSPDPDQPNEFARVDPNLPAQGGLGKHEQNDFPVHLESHTLGLRDLDHSDLRLVWKANCGTDLPLAGCTSHDNWIFDFAPEAVFDAVPGWTDGSTHIQTPFSDNYKTDTPTDKQDWQLFTPMPALSAVAE